MAACFHQAGELLLKIIRQYASHFGTAEWTRVEIAIGIHIHTSVPRTKTTNFSLIMSMIADDWIFTVFSGKVHLMVEMVEHL